VLLEELAKLPSPVKSDDP
jgi:hydroxymethylglutaryl-CoA synthase